ncbi:hypothetical protein MMC29_003642, partial [Sticta canariensis]|nr:hypothetical protein [Sticta canariensis]
MRCMRQALLHVLHAIAAELVQKEPRVQMAAFYDHGLAVSETLHVQVITMSMRLETTPLKSSNGTLSNDPQADLQLMQAPLKGEHV